MSPSTADWQLRLEAAAWVAHTPGGTRRTAVGNDPVAALERLGLEGSTRGTSMRVILADAWLRYLVVHWPPQVRRPDERRVFLAHRFQQVHGVAAPEWTLAVDVDAIGFPCLACAAPAALVDALRALAGRCGAQLRSLDGDFVDCFNRRRTEFNEAPGQLGALAVVRQGRGTVGLWRSGAWIAVRSQPLGEHDAPAVRRMIELLRPPDGEAPGVLYCAGEAAAPDGWRVRPLLEGAR